MITVPKIRDVGYCAFLLKHAINPAVPELTVYHQDEEGQQVIALAEGEESRMSAFKKAVTEKQPALMNVSNITFESYDGEVGRASDLAMLCSFVQLEKAISLMRRRATLTSTPERMPALLLEKAISLMRRREESQRDTVDEIRGLRGDLKLIKNGRPEWKHDIRQIKGELGLK